MSAVLSLDCKTDTPSRDHFRIIIFCCKEVFNAKFKLKDSQKSNTTILKLQAQGSVTKLFCSRVVVLNRLLLN